MSYSQDYRKMVLEKLGEGNTYRYLAKEYKVSTSTIQRWEQNVEPVVRKFTPTKIDNEQLIADVQAYPDDYQYQRARRFNCSDRGIGKALKRLGITRKKRP